jgi:hypothetical protein
MTQHVLKLTHTAHYYYDPAKVLAFARSTPELEPLLYGVTEDDDVIIYTFEALADSQLADALFASDASDDVSCELLTREDDE